MPECQTHGIIQYAPLRKITCKELEKRKKRKTVVAYLFLRTEVNHFLGLFSQWDFAKIGF